MEVAELFVALESNHPHIVEDVKKKFHELFNSCNPNDAWLVNGLFDYSMQTGSLRTVEILVGIREPHDTHLFNKFCESLRNNNKLNGLTLLGHIVRRQPPWLYKIARHSLFRDLLRLLRNETEIIPLMSALLVVNILLPMVAGLMEPHLQDIFQVFSHLAVWDSTNPSQLSEAHLLHLQMALYALFLRLYGMYPCNFLSYLRQEYSQPHKKAIFAHTIKPMLDNVKMHPLLVTASKDFEIAPTRWRKMEPHDVVVECAKFAIGGEADRSQDDGGARISLDFSQTLDVKYSSRSASSGLSDKDVWSPVSFCGMATPPESAPTSIPHTPIAQTHIVSTSFPQQEGTSPPEAAVEATPETTPVKDLRSVMRGPPSNSNIPRALNPITSSPSHSQPSSPMKKEPSPFRFPSNSESSAFHQPHDLRRDSLISQKVQRIVTDRSQLAGEGAEGKMKPRGLLQPTSPLRVINNGGPSESPCDPTEDDREVEIMMAQDNNSHSWSVRQCDSVVQDIAASADQEELEECQQDCAAAGLCMPNSNSMRDFTRQVRSRLRYYSQCHADNPCPGLSTGSSPSEGCPIPLNSKVRRANSCPEMKKASTSLERYSTVEKVEEEPSPVNGHATPKVTASTGQTLQDVAAVSDERQTTSAATQTDNPLPYEHLFLAVFPTVDHHQLSSGVDTGHSSPLPQKRFSPNEVDLFVNTSTSVFCDTKKNKLNIDFELRCCKEQLLLMSLQLHFEKHRREMHAERNRRLLGKCRKVRSQEELTAALKDQLSLLQNENEALHCNLHKRMDEAKIHAQHLQEKIAYYQNQNTKLEVEFTKEKALRESAEQALRQERERITAVIKELNEMKAALFTTVTELQHAASAACEGRELRETVVQHTSRSVVLQELNETKAALFTTVTELQHTASAACEGRELREMVVQRTSRCVVLQELNEMKAALFTTVTELQHAASAACEGRELRETVVQRTSRSVVLQELNETKAALFTTVTELQHTASAACEGRELREMVVQRTSRCVVLQELNETKAALFTTVTELQHAASAACEGRELREMVVQRTSRCVVLQELNETKAALFTTATELQDAASAAGEGRELRETVVQRTSRCVVLQELNETKAALFTTVTDLQHTASAACEGRELREMVVQRTSRCVVLQELNETKAALFTTATELQDAASAAGEGRELRETVVQRTSRCVVLQELNETKAALFTTVTELQHAASAACEGRELREMVVQRTSRCVVLQELNETKAALFTTATELQDAASAAGEGRELRETVVQRTSRCVVLQELNETKAALFTTATELQHAASAAGEGRELRETVVQLQRELVVGGETQERYRQRVNSLLRHLSQSSETSLLQESFSQQIAALNQALDTQTSSLEAAKTRVGELESILGKKEATIAEFKRLLQVAKDEYHEQLEAVESKYKSLRAVNSRLEGELLELRHRLSGCDPAPVLPPALPPAPPSHAFHDLRAGADSSPPQSPVPHAHNG